MKIAILHYSVPPIVGGVESVIAHHARLMSEDGHSVRLIAGRGESFADQPPLTLIELMDSKHPQVLAVKTQLDHGQVTDDFVALRDELVSQLQITLSKVDVLIAHNICSLHKNLALTAALFHLHNALKLPRLILWHHDLAWTTPRYRHELHDGYPWDFLRQAWSKAQQVTISNMRQQELTKLFQIDANKIAVIPNGVDTAKFHKLEELTKSFIKRVNLSQASPVLLLPVRITSRKNIELALQTLAHLQKDFPNSALVVTGPLGPHNPANEKYFEKLLSLRSQLGLVGSAHFLAELTDGFIPDEVISDFYHLTDALFLPSLEEGFGIPLLEAGMADIPVFCSDIPSLRKIGGDFVKYFGLNSDPAQVARLMSDHFKSSDIYKLRHIVHTNYAWEHIYTKKIRPLLGNEEQS